MPDQIPLIGPRGGLRPRLAAPGGDAVVGRVSVLVDAPVARAGGVYDYAVPQRLAGRIAPGCRVLVPLGSQTRPGFVVSGGFEPLRGSIPPETLKPVTRLVSPVPVLTPQVLRLCEAVAEHYAGAPADVVRFAVPPRVAALERGYAISPVAPVVPPPAARGLAATRFADHAVTGQAVRGVWAAPARAEWARELALLAARVAHAGRGSLLLVPDRRDAVLLASAARELIPPAHVAVLSAEDGNHTRYEQFLAVLSGRARVVIGTRAAAFAPVAELGLVALWDDTDDTYVEQRAPYWHAREVLALRSHEQACSLLVAGFARSCEAQQWVARAWAHEVMPRTAVRAGRPAVRPVGDPRSPVNAFRRFPEAAVRALRTGLAEGPVLVQVSRTGHAPVTACQDCRTPARCPECDGMLQLGPAGEVTCARCGRPVTFVCPECAGTGLRAARVGATRTAEELARLFPRADVVLSTGAALVNEVGPAPAVVVATPGAEPRCATGYHAAFLPDAQLDLWRPGVRARELAAARWFRAAAAVAPGAPVVVAGDAGDPAVQALVRWDPAGLAARELAVRSETRLPPAVHVLQLDGGTGAMDRLLAVLDPGIEVLGPLEIGDDRVRVLLRSPDFPALRAGAAALVATLPADPGASWRLQVDPPDLA